MSVHDTGNTAIKVNVSLDGNNIENINRIVLLGITINDKLVFNTHIEKIFVEQQIQITRVIKHKKVFKYR